MKGQVEVVTQAEFDVWMISQKAKYQTAVLDKQKTDKPVADTTAKAAVVSNVAPNTVAVKK